ncbi:mitochondrial S-adenosylmethionine carrier protein isoform X2 [Hypanus sabinus]|uniref:mitochondrial S-adenosylmethionine carrier protein isoform X2 n=1 Tax=Hypanus sabinus TaxID=79690 RepID=UPI0028C429B1|nr:mitochondrial S-adenosylmethionine carrier protein isoform X2 [Hypanus sabinus]XP_059800267.1 mitochondrial S-adenosylmethionine carrier protein isoform X2 [Hypanus sabinus]
MEVREFMSSLVAGGMAGMCVDLTLFPLDTVKTRLQSQQGFYKAGGFRGIYAGVPSAAIGSFPNAALFFVTYECTKSVLGPMLSTKEAPLLHMLAASLGEMVACLIRVPTEVVKQRSQACPTLGTQQVFIETIKQEGILGLYRGFGSTVKREIPFALVQFPLWEFLKVTILSNSSHTVVWWSERFVQFCLYTGLIALWSWKQDHAVDSWQSAVCGAFAGGFAAAVTTPLDVAKTRIMLAKKGTTTASGKVLPILSHIWKTQGIYGHFSLCHEFPRVTNT